jgi:DNA-binding IclR family transcriptional regulator
MSGEHSTKNRGSALEKALLVLNAITRQPQAIGLPDIADKTRLPRQTVHRILLQLENSGLILRDPTRDRFSVGAKLAELALSALHSENHNFPTRHVLQQLVDDLQETCNVGYLRGMEFVYLDRIECAWPLRMSLSTGSVLPAHCAAGGKAILAFLPTHVRARLLQSVKLVTNTPRSISDIDALEKDLAIVREKGFATTIEEFCEGIIGVAVPIMDSSGRVVASLAFHGPTTRVDEAKAISHVPRMQDAADQLAILWGLRDEEEKIAI